MEICFKFLIGGRGGRRVEMVEGGRQGKRRKECYLNIDVIRFLHETPLFFPGSDGGLSKYILGNILIIIGLTHSSTVYEKQSSFTLQNLHYYSYLTR